MALAMLACVRLTFDRGTLLLEEPPADLDVGALPEVQWDARVGKYRAPGRVVYPIASELRRRGVSISDMPRPAMCPPSGFRLVDELRPYQEAALSAWRFAGRRGVVALPTGGGKTAVALAAIAATRAPCLCLVPTRALLVQWVGVLAACYDGPIGRFGDGERVLASITVATFASAFRHMSAIGDRFGLLVVDEAHHFGHGRFDEALEMAIAPLRLGLTGTPPSPGPAAERLGALVGPVVFERSVRDLGPYLAPLERITWRLALESEERREYDALRVVYRRAWNAYLGNHLGASWEDFLRHASQTDDGRRGIAAWRRARKLLAFPRRKREALSLLLARHRGSKTLVFVADNDTAYAVARSELVTPLTCDIGRRERDDVLARFRAGSLRTLVSAQVLNEGLDVPDAEVGIVVAGRLGEREHAQRVGRLLRPGEGKRALVYELVVGFSSEVRDAERRWERFAPTG